MKIDIGHCSISIETSANNDGPVLLLAHSFGCDLHMWDLPMSALEPAYRVVRLDMRGHGQSDVPAGPYTLDGLADDVIAVMDHLDIGQAHRVGLSGGGMIGQSLLLRYPERFLSAALCDSMSEQPVGAEQLWADCIAAVRANGIASIADATLQRWFTSAFLAVEQEACDAVRARFVVTPTAGFIASCQAIARLDYIERLSSIQAPIAVIVGREDPATPLAASEAMHDRLPNSRLIVLDDAAHISNVEQATAFNEALLTFFAVQS